MCGFVGFTKKIDDNNAILTNMMNRIKHRGPDSSDVFVNENISLGFRRLGFLDLESGSQPMFNEDSSIVLVFNGEIYNYLELKEELINKGHIFKTKTDSEVLIHLYEEEKENMVHRLRGMFAFIIHDITNNTTFGVRDFFGVKPMYYTFVDGTLLFGSEIKSFLEYPNFKKELNIEAFENYLSFQYSPLEECMFKNVFKLMPGCYFKYENNEMKITKYFTPEFNETNMSFDEAVDKIDSVMADSVKKHKHADVEVGSFLSSGVDSSYVAATFKGDKTFTVGFENKLYSEVSYAKELSSEIGIENISKTISPEEYFNILPTLQYHMDEPLADPSAIALYFVSNISREEVKGCMSGEGADEFFGGYGVYKQLVDMKPYINLPLFIRRFIKTLVKLIPFNFKGKNFIIRAGTPMSERFFGNATMFSVNERKTILKNPTINYGPMDVVAPLYKENKKMDEITQMQLIDLNYWMPGDILLKADKMSMANSLEVRVPILDIEVFKVASSLKTEYRVNTMATKYAFRQAAKRHLKDTVADKKKLGFPVPTREWIKEEKYYNMIVDTFKSDYSNIFFKEEEILKLLEDHKNKKCDNSRKVWTIYTFLIWYKRFFIDEKEVM